ncbi:MAG TPA: UDP-2,3-diacylglucosamine diphosphatase [Bacteroidota bacterium]|nr:UDP-2,3-diacylglucosamine diphosphatase [Bacteroidota bacterium]
MQSIERIILTRHHRFTLKTDHTALSETGAVDAVIISDIHLGSNLCQAKKLAEFLERILTGLSPTKQLILNGDVFDSIDFRRLQKNHWKILSLLRKLSDKISITWVCGNHDGPAEIISHLLGVSVKEEHTFSSGGKSFLVLHGHVFDDFIEDHRTITAIADSLYNVLQKIDRTHRFAKFAKTNSKIFLRCTQKIRERSLKFAADRRYDVVCCGHTHHAEIYFSGNLQYCNSGCWTESPCTYLTIQDGIVGLQPFLTLDDTINIIDAPPSKDLIELPNFTN